MGFRIQNNVPAMKSWRYLNVNEANQNKVLERLSSGYRINSAADDAAGLAASMRLRLEIASLKVSSRNAAEASSLLQVTEGAMSQLERILIRMKELATQAASANAGDDLTKINAEATALKEEINRIIGFTQYNGRTLLDGSFGATALSPSATISGFLPVNGVENIDVNAARGGSLYYVSGIDAGAETITIQEVTIDSDPLTPGDQPLETRSQTLSYHPTTLLGTNEDTVLNFNELGVKIQVNEEFQSHIGSDIIAGTSATGSSFATGPLGNATFQIGDRNDGTSRLSFSLPNLVVSALDVDIDLTTQENAQDAIEKVNTAVSNLAMARGDIGALLNRLEYIQSNLSVSIENKSASESTIRDADMASDASELVKHQILVQSSTAMLAQANTTPQAVLSLLK